MNFGVSKLSHWDLLTAFYSLSLLVSYKAATTNLLALEFELIDDGEYLEVKKRL